MLQLSPGRAGGRASKPGGARDECPGLAELLDINEAVAVEVQSAHDGLRSRRCISDVQGFVLAGRTARHSTVTSGSNIGYAGQERGRDGRSEHGKRSAPWTRDPIA
jgi:hypothetical protein